MTPEDFGQISIEQNPKEKLLQLVISDFRDLLGITKVGSPKLAVLKTEKGNEIVQKGIILPEEFLDSWMSRTGEFIPTTYEKAFEEIIEETDLPEARAEDAKQAKIHLNQYLHYDQIEPLKMAA